ncbi:uncharacterized protein [Medicago truncatula]|uniref:uncharacterized protein n=1 Tax=Medicago truncatula TaxID=3880 RepID=UPI0019677BCA|nr:uncharacterized protein LOC112422571 [Medicago truncatula]
MINMQDTNQRLNNLSCQMEKMQLQLSDIDIQLSNRLLHEKRTDVSTENEEVSEIGEEGVDQTEEGATLDGCGEIESAKEIEMPHKEEFPQERPYTEEAETIENEEVMEVTEKKERILIKEESMEGKGKKVNKVEIDRIIDEICALFNKPNLGRIWTPHHLYLKFMEFLPKRRITKDDVLSVSFRPP